MSRQIFISYRRGDAADWAGRLYDHLGQKIGQDNVFLDVQQIAPGANFVRVLENEVDRSDVVLLLIGPRWLTGGASNGANRLADPDDFVRREIERAIVSGVPILPVLVAGGTMPAVEDLPESIRQIVKLPRMKLDEPGFEADAGSILSHVMEQPQRQIAQAVGSAEAQKASGWHHLWMSLSIAITAYFVAVFVFGIGKEFGAFPLVVAIAMFGWLAAAERFQSLPVFLTLATISVLFTLAAISRLLDDYVKFKPETLMERKQLAIVALIPVVFQAAALVFLFFRNRKRMHATAVREWRLVAGPAEFAPTSVAAGTRVILVGVEPDTEAMLGRLQSRLRGRLGNAVRVIVMGGEAVDATPPRQTDVAVVLVGRSFADYLAGDGALSSHRFSASQAAMQEALRAGAHVTPLVIEGATMPGPERLPEQLRDLSWRNATPLRHAHFDSDIEQVIAVIEDRRALVRDVAAGFGRRKSWIDKFTEDTHNALLRSAGYAFGAFGIWLVGGLLAGGSASHGPAVATTPLGLFVFLALTYGAMLFPLFRPQERSLIVFLALLLISAVGILSIGNVLEKYGFRAEGSLARAKPWIVVGHLLWFPAILIFRAVKRSRKGEATKSPPKPGRQLSTKSTAP